jgi:uncharacterized DUF497 family protein
MGTMLRSDIEKILAEAIGFDWDEGNINKSWIKHLVSPEETEEVFYNVPLLLLSDDKHSGMEQRFTAMGKTDAGRLLFTNWTMRSQRIRPISTRAMNFKERKTYEQET